MNIDKLKTPADVDAYWLNFSEEEFNQSAAVVGDFLAQNKDIRDLAILRKGLIAKAAVAVHEKLVPVPLTRQAWTSLHGYGMGYPSAFEREHGLRGSEV